MVKSEIQNILAVVYPAELVAELLTTYERALAEYKKGNWKYSGNEIGQFIEVARRMIETQLNGTYTPLSEKLTIFNEKVLADWEHTTASVPEEYRIIIPRTLYTMSCLRNKRGMIHKNHIDPNRMDATALLGNAKWVLAEFFRLTSTLPFVETEEIINSIMCRETFIIWDTGSTLRILDTKMSTANQVLCLLYVKDGQTDSELQSSIEYKNPTEFRRLLRRLHQARLVEYSDSKCYLSPLGISRAEGLLAG